MKKINLINNPFSQFCINLGFAPTSYSEALTYEEQILWLIKFLEQTVIPSIQDCEEAVIELQGLYEELKNYVDHYFDNLDVQEEINNKLDDMVEQGTLQEIITSYLQVNGVLSFDTISDMSDSENLIDGSTCYCLGEDTYNDGKGAFYKVREIINTDVVDGINIVALDVSNTLIAERMPNYYITNLQNQIDRLSYKKYIFVGDSYLQGYTPDGEVENWGAKLANLLGLTSGQWRRVARGGTAMNITNENNFFNLISEQTADNDVTDVILCAGYNDHQEIGTYNAINQGLIAFKNKVHELYPNATLRIGFIGNTSIVNDKYDVSRKCPFYIKSCKTNSVIYLNNVEYALHNYNTEFGSDGIHPNELGQSVIAEAIFQALTTGSAHIVRERTPMNSGGSSIYMTQENGTIRVISNSFYSGNYPAGEHPTINMTGGNYIEQYVGNNTLIVGCTDVETNGATIPVFFVEEDNKTILVQCKVSIYNGILRLYPFKLNDAGSNYYSATLKAFQIRPFTYECDALYN